MTAASSAMYHTTKQLAIQPTHKRNSSTGTSTSPMPRRMSHSPQHPPLMPSKSSQTLVSPSAAAKKAEKQQRALAQRQRKAEIKSGIGLVQMNVLTRPQTPRVMLSGYLQKMSTGHTWSEVYLLLSTLSLHCFQPVSTTHTITQLLEDELWHIPIHHCIVHHNCEDERKFAITTKQATVVLKAATKQDAWMWRSSIKEVKRAYLSHHTITCLTTAATSLRCVTVKEEEKEIVVGKGVTWNTPINIKDVSPDAILHAELMNGGTLSIPLAQLLQTGECTLQFDNTVIATRVLIRWETQPSTSTPTSSSASTSSPDTPLPHPAILVLFDLIIPVVFFLVALYVAKAISSLTPPQQAVNQRYDTTITFVSVSHDTIEGTSTSTSTSTSTPTSAVAPLSISVPSSTTTSPLASSSSVDTATFASRFFPQTPPSVISMRRIQSIPSETHSEPTTGYHTPRQQHTTHTFTPTHGDSQQTSQEEPMDAGSSKGSKHKSSSSTSTSSSSTSTTTSTSSSTSTSTSKSSGGRDDGDDEDEKRHRHVHSNDHASDHRGHKKKKSTSSVDDLAVPNPHHDEKLAPLSSPIHESISAPCDINEDIPQENNDVLDDDGPVKPSLQTSTPMIQVPWGGWTTADWRSLAVRGPTYLTSKQKIASKPPMFRLEHVDIVNTNEKIYNIASRPESWFARTYEARNAAIQKEMAEAAASEAGASDPSSSTLAAPSTMTRSQSLVTPSTYTTTAAQARRASTIAAPEEESKRTDGSDRLRTSSPDFFLIVNFLVPGSPGYNLTCYFSRKRVGKDAKNGDEPADCAVLPGPALTAFNTALNRFVCGSDKYRNTHVKIIPAVVDGGNWLVRNAVGNRPAILGNKLTQTYHTDEKKNYLEIDVDVGSSRVGSSILKVAKSYAKCQRLDELPEAILGGVRLHHLDLENTLSLAESYKQAINEGKKK